MRESREDEFTSYAAREALIGELLNEFLDRKAAGEGVSESEWLDQHPELASDLREHLELLREIEPTRIAVGELVKNGILTKPMVSSGIRRASRPIRHPVGTSTHQIQRSSRRNR